MRTIRLGTPGVSLLPHLMGHSQSPGPPRAKAVERYTLSLDGRNGDIILERHNHKRRGETCAYMLQSTTLSKTVFLDL